MLQWWGAVDNTTSDLPGPRFEPQTSRSRDELVTARPTSRYGSLLHLKREEAYVAEFKVQGNKLPSLKYKATSYCHIGSPKERT